MSQVLRHGTEAGYHRANWNGKHVECPMCHCVFVITATTPGSITKISKVNYKFRAQCPECSMTMAQITFY